MTDVVSPFIGTLLIGRVGEARIWLGVSWFPVAIGRGAPWPTSLSLRGRLPGFNPPWRGFFIVWYPSLGECRRGRGIFGAAGRVWATAMHPDPPKKRLYEHRRPSAVITFDDYSTSRLCYSNRQCEYKL